MALLATLTRETPVPGRVVWQPHRGFRYGAEAFWLVGWALEGGLPQRALDLGTGSGIAALLLAHCGVRARGLDVRPEWRPLWERTLAESGLGPALTLEQRDIREVLGDPPDVADLVVSNPPFFAAGTGPVAADPWKAAARTESTATLADFLDAGTHAMGPAGRLCIVVPREREREVAAWSLAHRPSISRLARVGRRRSLIELSGSGSAGPPEAFTEADPRVGAWYTRLGARWIAPRERG